MQVVLYALLNFFLSGLGLVLLFTTDFITSPKLVLVIWLTTSIGYLIWKKVMKFSDKKTSRLAGLTTTNYVVLLISSWLYSVWTFDRIFSAEMITQFTMALLLFLGYYANFMFMRAETSYKKKRGNQRIQVEPSDNIFEKMKKAREEKDSNEVFFILGESTENED